MEPEASDELGDEFRKSFEDQSKKLFEQNKRAANLKGPVVNPFVKFVVQAFNTLSETNLSVEGDGNDKFCYRVVSAKQKRLDNWHLMYRIFVAYVCLKLLFLVDLHYRFDLLRVEYDKAKSAHQADLSLRQPTISEASRADNQQEIRQSLNQSSHLLQIQKLKDHYENVLLHFNSAFAYNMLMSECCLVYAVLAVVVFYWIPLVVCRVKGPFNVSLIRLLADEDNEWQNVNQLVLNEIEEIIQSSKTHLTKSIIGVYERYNPTRCEDSTSGQTLGALVDMDRAELDPEVRNLIMRHKNNIRLLKKLALSGSLHPPNRMPDWTARVVAMFINFWVVLFVIASIGIVSTNIFSDLYFGKAIRLSGLMSAISLIDFEFLTIFGTVSQNFWLALFLYVFIDQYYIVSKLRESFQKFIKTNCLYQDQFMSKHCYLKRESRTETESNSQLSLSYHRNESSNTLYELLESGSHDRRDIIVVQHHSPQSARIDTDGISPKRPESSENEARISELNESLLKLLTNYRIFVHQFRQLKELFSQMTIYIHIFFVLYPLYMVLHVPYIARRYCILFVSLVWLYMTNYNLSLLPICAYHSQCKHLHKLLFTLLAHIDEIQDRDPDKSPVYDPFVVALLRRAVDNPCLAVRRISITPFGGPLSYIHILRMHFWAGILSIYALFACETRVGLFTKKPGGGSSFFGFA